MTVLMEEYDEDRSPPPSQPRPVREPQYPQHREPENSPPKQDPGKRGQKRKHTDTKAVKAKIAKTEQCIDKLEKHLTKAIEHFFLVYRASAKHLGAARILESYANPRWNLAISDFMIR